ncbi:MAG TPA: hypothetical protein VGE81_08055 [Candidatus Limnocylindrales bacterium]|jgi:hypothetical protein
MSAMEIVMAFRRRGIFLIPSGDGRLMYFSQDELASSDQAFLADHDAEIIAELESDPLEWRVVILSDKVRRLGAHPLLFARPGANIQRGSCLSCGEPMEPHDHYRCALCLTATLVVLCAVEPVGAD